MMTGAGLASCPGLHTRGREGGRTSGDTCASAIPARSSWFLGHNCCCRQAEAMRTGFLYMVIVGLPIAGTCVVLESGRNLQALPAIGGAWTLQISSPSADPGCWPPGGSGVATTMTVEQSGENLVLSLPGFSGRPSLVARLRMRRSDRAGIAALATEPAPNRTEGVLVGFNATVDHTAVPFVMEGTFSTAACNGGSAFRATHSPVADRKDRSH